MFLDLQHVLGDGEDFLGGEGGSLRVTFVGEKSKKNPGSGSIF
jgi:hypothetical protein